ncbi:MAG TPA: four helix bundle protein [Bacteroidetes bacterium]|nr:four helix bundle protein [Bacteroidota bacterium]
MAFKFENLEVWKLALNISDDVNKIANHFPRHEMFQLSSQIRRAADSAVLNIAEGSQGQSDREFARFLSMSIRSSIEVVSCLYIAEKRGYLEDIKNSKIYLDLETVIKRTQALKNKLIPRRLIPILTICILLWSMVYGLWSNLL